MQPKSGKPQKVISKNIKTEMKSEKPQKQAVAIPMKKAGLSKESPKEQKTDKGREMKIEKKEKPNDQYGKPIKTLSPKKK